MKDKIKIYKATGEISKLDLSLISGNIYVRGVEKGPLRVTKKRRCHVKITESDGLICVKQVRKPMIRRAEVTVEVPSHCMPEISVNAEQTALEIDGGIYCGFKFKGGDGDVKIHCANFESVNLYGDGLNLNMDDVAVRNDMNLKAMQAEMTLNGGFANTVIAEFKNADVGLTQFTCRDGDFKLEKGSINLNFCGKSEDYALNLISRQGTCNRENTESGDKNVKVYTDSANIVVDFTEAEK